MRRLITAVMLAIGVVLTGCQSSTNAAMKGNAEAGKILFESGTAELQACNSCHSIDGAPEVGPSLKGIADRAGSRVPGQIAETYLLTSILRPNDYIVTDYAAGIMPSYTQLTDQEQQDLVTYLLTLK